MNEGRAPEILGAGGNSLRSAVAAILCLREGRPEDAAHMRQLAHTDDLTGLHNLRSFEESYQTLIRQARANQTPLALLVLDLDHLKSINERYGHLAGAHTIQALGKNLTVEAFIAAHLKRVKPGDYIAMLDFIRETDENETLIQAIRAHLRDALRVATTTGYGPRFLHSTGQLHKGGDDSGVFIQITADDLKDAPIVGEPFTFGVLKQAQALGDFQSLASRDRRAIRVHMGDNISAGLKTLLEVVRTAFPVKTP